MEPIRQEIAAAEAIKQQEIDKRRRRKLFIVDSIEWSGIIPYYYFELGYIYQPNYPIGIRMGFLGFYLTASSSIDYKENGFYRYRDSMVTVGFSFNIIDCVLTLPVGFGSRNSYDTLFEIGLSFYPMKWISLLATYRLISQESSFALGTCFTWWGW